MSAPASPILSLQNVWVEYADKVVLEKVDLDVAATLFNQYANMAFIRLATQEVPDRPAHASHMRGVLQLLCHGMLEG